MFDVFHVLLVSRLVLIYLRNCRIVKKWCMNGLESVEVAKGLDLSAITTKGEKRLPANVYLALELVLMLLLPLYLCESYQVKKNYI